MMPAGIDHTPLLRCERSDRNNTGISRMRDNRQEYEMAIVNAIIKTASITSDDHGLLSAWLFLDYGGTAQGFGGYSLYLPKSFSHHDIKSPAGHFIFRCMEVAGVTKWENMAGKTIRVDQTHSGVSGIGHIVKDDWFYPAKDFADIGKKEPA